MSAMDHSNYRSFLKETLEVRCRKNPALSLRSLAIDLGISASHFSRVLNGQKKISLAMAGQIALRLKLSEQDSAYFAALVQLENTNDETTKAQILKRLSGKGGSTGKILSLEKFRVISDWYHFSILTLVKAKNFRNSAHWIGKRIGISALEAKLAVERLLSLELLTEKNGKLAVDNEGHISTTDDISSAAIRENHKQHLLKSIEALEKLPVSLREFNNLSICADPKEMERAKKMIRQFVEKFNREFDCENAEEIFQLNLQFYQLSSPIKGDPRENN